jgi:hypothetical protein
MNRIFHPHLIAKFRSAYRVAQPWAANTKAWTVRVVNDKDFKWHVYGLGSLSTWTFVSYKLFHCDRRMSENSAMQDAFFCVVITIPVSLVWPIMVPLYAAAKVLASTDDHCVVGGSGDFIPDETVRCDHHPKTDACKRCALKTGY